LTEIRRASTQNNIAVEVIVSDNGSTDRSKEIAFAAGAEVIHAPIKGYGAALNAGIRSAKSNRILIGDADFSYNFMHINRFIKELSNGSDLVVGNRFLGEIHSKAMPKLHRYLGNPVLSRIARILFRIPLGDFHCGLRAFRKDKYLEANPVTSGMEFATEMIIRFANIGSKISEVPTDLRCAKRSRKPHLRSFPDGWRHLKLMLLYSPNFIQFYPGILGFLFGLYGVLSYVLFGKINLYFVTGSLQAALFSLTVSLLGFQLILSGILNMEYATTKGVKRFQSKLYSSSSKFLKSRECVIVSLSLIVMAIGFFASVLVTWERESFGFLDPFGISKNMFLFAVFGAFGTQSMIASLQLRQYSSRFW
jgi:glycosyltransferase involved in cell wall biosynthesis